MNEQQQLRARARSLNAYAGLAAVVAIAVHLLLLNIAGEVSVLVVLLDVVIALVVLGVAWTAIDRVKLSRQRTAALAVLPRELAAPRSIEVATFDAMEALVRSGLATSAAVGLAGSASGEMRLAAAVGFPEDFGDSAELLTLPRANEPAVAVEDPLDHPWARALDRTRQQGDVTGSAPLVIGSESLGLLLLGAPNDSILDVPLMARLAEQLAGIVDHAALYEASFERERELEEQEERRSEFMSAIAHEIRTPLTSIQAFAEILNLNPANLEPGASDLVQSLSEAVHRLRTLVDELIEVGRGTDLDERAELRPLDVGEVVTYAVSVLRPAVVSREQLLTLDLPPAPLLASADDHYLQHVVMNLLSNANRHTPRGGSILVRAGVPSEGRVRIEVTDSGPGIEPSDRERIFEAYYRVHRQGTSEVPGAGLGLAIARRFTELQGGRIWVDAANSDGSGSRFSVELDAASVAAPADEPTITVPPPSGEAAANGGVPPSPTEASAAASPPPSA
jgi:signal transduction histidine kinase